MSLVDILFVVTVALLAFNGFRNGAVISLVNLISIPIGIVVALLFGKQLTQVLASNNLPATPFIAYIVLFFGTVLVLHIIGTVIRGVVQKIPFVGFGDALLGALIGFVEAWLLWLVLLLVLGSFLHNAQGSIQQGSSVGPGLNIQVDQLKQWHDFYNETVSNSLFAKVNGFFIQELPNLPTPRPQ